jgi:hypothetical protein
VRLAGVDSYSRQPQSRPGLPGAGPLRWKVLPVLRGSTGTNMARFRRSSPFGEGAGPRSCAHGGCIRGAAIRADSLHPADGYIPDGSGRTFGHT